MKQITHVRQLVRKENPCFRMKYYKILRADGLCEKVWFYVFFKMVHTQNSFFDSILKDDKLSRKWRMIRRKHNALNKAQGFISRRKDALSTQEMRITKYLWTKYVKNNKKTIKKLTIRDYRMLRIERTMAMALRRYRALYKPIAFEFQFDLNPCLAQKRTIISAIYNEACHKRRKVMLENFADFPF